LTIQHGHTSAKMLIKSFKIVGLNRFVVAHSMGGIVFLVIFKTKLIHRFNHS